ncbi:MAG: YfiM family protein [Bacteroidetes bacterium]|nr:YfiM family protein [Bacteroidota bacterium]
MTLAFLLSFLTASAQESVISDSVNKKRLKTAVAVDAGLYVSAMSALYTAWYKGYDLTAFHWFDDRREWLQVDKVGHGYSGYCITDMLAYGFRWSGMNRKRSALIAGGIAWGVIASVEYFDGLSARWGASWSDLAANTTGIVLFSGQEILWNEQRIVPKFSFHRTHYADYRPDYMGTGFIRSLVKDYNGQAYWLSFNIRSLTGREKIPAWLCVSIGYGADGMIGGTENPDEINGAPLPYFQRYRQYYLSLDVDFSKIKTRYAALNLLLKGVNYLKVPFPALEYGNKRFKGYWIYF